MDTRTPKTHEGKRAATEPLIVMSSRWTRLMGVVAFPVALFPFIWGWANDLPLWWMVLMSPVPVMFVAVGIQYVVLGRYQTLVLDQGGITYRPYEDPLTLLRRGPVVRLRWDEISSIGTFASLGGGSVAHDPVEQNSAASAVAASPGRR
jgi:hypothetical protein